MSSSTIPAFTDILSLTTADVSESISHNLAFDHTLDYITCCYVRGTNQLILLTNYRVIQFLKGGMLSACILITLGREEQGAAGAPCAICSHVFPLPRVHFHVGIYHNALHFATSFTGIQTPGSQNTLS